VTKRKIQKYIDLALPVCLGVDRSCKHASLIMRKGVVVSTGTNDRRTHPKAKEHGYLFDEVHSELDALLRYKGPKDNLILMNFRFNRFEEMRLAKPCCKCLPWCEAIFDKIYHTTRDGIIHI